MLRDCRPPPSQSACLLAPQHGLGLECEWKPLCLREGEGREEERKIKGRRERREEGEEERERREERGGEGEREDGRGEGGWEGERENGRGRGRGEVERGEKGKEERGVKHSFSSVSHDIK